MIKTQNIHSLTDFQRNTGRHIRKLRNSGLPEVLTVNGKAELIVQTADSYQALLTRLELCESAIAINRGLQDIRDGRACTPDEFDKRMRRSFRMLDGKR